MERKELLRKLGCTMVIGVCLVTLAGCPRGIVASLTDIPATVGTTLTLTAAEGGEFRKNTVVVFTIDDRFPLSIDEDLAEPWLLAFNQGDRLPPIPCDGATVPWDQGWYGEYRIGGEDITYAEDMTSITLTTPELLGLLGPARIIVSFEPSGKPPVELTYAPPPKLVKVTDLGDVNDRPAGNGLPYINVPGQVATRVGVDGLNLDDDAAVDWILEGDVVATGTLDHGQYVDTPALTGIFGPARLDMRVTNQDGQSSLLALAVLAEAPPSILQVRREGDPGVVQWPLNQVPATVPALIALCGTGLAGPCDYVVYTNAETGEELGRFDVAFAGNAVQYAGAELDCIEHVPTPQVSNLTEPLAVNVALHFPNGTYTEDESVTKKVGELVLVPPPQLTAAAPAAVPATPVTDASLEEITISGTYIHPSSEVQVLWQHVQLDENPAGVPLGDNPPDDFVTPATISGTALTFARPPLTTGDGSDPTDPALLTKGRTDRIKDDRKVAFVVRDVWGQTSDVLEDQTVYLAPPVISNWEVTSNAVENAEDFVLTGRNWGADTVTLDIKRWDTGESLPGYPIADQAFDLFEGTQSIHGLLPTVENPPEVDDGVIPLMVFLQNNSADNPQVTVARVDYLPANLTPLHVVNVATGYPEVGAVAPTQEAIAMGAVQAGRTVEISGFRNNAHHVEFILADGSLVGDPDVDDNPVFVGGNPVQVQAPSMVPGTITEDTNVYVRVTDANGQVTPNAALGVLIYKAEPQVTAIASRAPYSGAPTQFPATKPLKWKETVFEVAGSNLQPAEPYILGAKRATAVFHYWTGDQEPNTAGFTGQVVANAAEVYFEDGLAVGDTPLLAGLVTDQTCAVDFYDFYGQKATGALTLDAVAPPVLTAFEGLFNNHEGTPVTVANLVPGRDVVSGTPQFRIIGKNLNGGVSEVQFSSDSLPPNFPENNHPLTAAPTAVTYDAGPPETLVGNVPMMAKADLPDTIGDVVASVIGPDDQIGQTGNITFTAPPVIDGVLANGVSSNLFIANATVAPAFTVTGDKLDPGGLGGGNFSVSFGSDVVFDPNTAAILNNSAASFALAVNDAGTAADPADDYISLNLGDMPFTYVSYMGQQNEIQYNGGGLTAENLYLSSVQGPDAGALESAIAVVVADFTGDGNDDVAAVSVGQYEDIELRALADAANAAAAGSVAVPVANANTLRIDVWNGVAGALMNSVPSTTLMVQDANDGNPLFVNPPARPQFLGSIFGGGIRNNPAQFAAAGDVTGDGVADLVLGVWDDSTDVDVDPDPAVTTLQSLQTGAVYVFQGAAGGLQAVSATNPVKVGHRTALRTGEQTWDVIDQLGASVLLADVTGSATADIVVGAPAVDFYFDVDATGAANAPATPDDISDDQAVMGAGAVYVYAGGAAFTVPTMSMDLAPAWDDAGGQGLGATLGAGDVSTGTAGLEVLAGGADRVYVFAGGTATGATSSPGMGNFSALGDFDGDGVDDLVVTGGTNIDVYYGGAVLATTPDANGYGFNLWMPNQTSAAFVASEGLAVAGVDAGSWDGAIATVAPHPKNEEVVVAEPVGSHVNPAGGYGSNLASGAVIGGGNTDYVVSSSDVGGIWIPVTR